MNKKDEARTASIGMLKNGEKLKLRSFLARVIRNLKRDKIAISFDLHALL